jgi:hypothetical protein
MKTSVKINACNMTSGKETTCNNANVMHATSQVYNMQDVMDGFYNG